MPAIAVAAVVELLGSPGVVLGVVVGLGEGRRARGIGSEDGDRALVGVGAPGEFGAAEVEDAEVGFAEQLETIVAEDPKAVADSLTDFIDRAS